MITGVLRINSDWKLLYEATDNLINQQFYMDGSDTIVGRTRAVSLKIRNSGQVISKFKNLFKSNMPYFVEGNYIKFLEPFIKIKGITKKILIEISSELSEKLEFLKGTDIDMVVLYTIVISSLISRIRDMQFKSSLDELNRRIKQKSSLSNVDIKKELDELFMRNHDYISILYNISYLDALAESYNYRKLSHICKIQKGIFLNKLVKLIIEASN